MTPATEVPSRAGTAAGQILRIDRGAVHDGPGVRTVVFFKGCPLTCAWCHSPDTQAAGIQILIYRDRCITCECCVEACDTGAAVRENDHVSVDRARCEVCGRCVDVCPTGAREIAGRAMTVDEVMADVLRDRPFFDLSGGGVTLSGGEPLMQAEFALALLAACRREGIHTAVETCGLVPPDVLMRAAEVVDLFLYDLKLIDDARHRTATRGSNTTILENLAALAAVRQDIIVRFPLVPGVNDDWHNVAATAAFVASLGLARIDVLPYHRAGVARYERLSRPYALDATVPPDDAGVAAVVDVLRRAGLEVHAGGSS